MTHQLMIDGMAAWALTGELVHSTGQVGDWPPGEEPSSHILKDDYEIGRWMEAGASQGGRVFERGGEQW